MSRGYVGGRILGTTSDTIRDTVSTTGQSQYDDEKTFATPELIAS